MSALTTPKDKPPEIEVPSIGLGTMRSSGTYIVLLLHLETEYDRAGILTEAAKQLGITLEELTDQYLDKACEKCGCSIARYHKPNNGQCP